MRKNVLIILTLVYSSILFAQETKKVKIFYDCQTWNCDVTYVKQNLPEVEFVRDRNFADVHILIVSENNGSGGNTYHLEFFGQNDYKEIQEKFDFSTGSDSTKDDFRAELIKYLKLGLLKFWMKNGLADKLQIDLNIPKKETKEADKWNNWVFKLGINGWYNGSSNHSNSDYSGYISAKQIKEKNKFMFSLRYNKGKSTYKYGSQEILSEKEFFNISLSEVIGINEHWSYGVFTRFDRSKYSNYQQAYEVFGGLEYSFFPYKESSKHSLVLSLQTGSLYNKYFEKTVYNKTDEWLWRSKVYLNGDLVKKWGNLYAGLEYKVYLHNFDLNSFGFNLGTSLRLAKGLNFNTNAYYGITHDQINIAAGNLSLEETLLAQKELQSGYNYYFNVGLSYSFGSIYNSIVNPRFDNAGDGQGRTCVCF
jgi:hypothetical protein